MSTGTTRLLLHIVMVATVSALDATVQVRLIKAHGIMMILAWFIFVATAIMFARYFRGHWPQTKPMGLLMWFHFHRTFNTIALLLMIAAFICIFTAFGWEWMGPPQNRGVDGYWGSVHSMVGLLSFVLALFQAMNSIFRCAPGKPLRPIFNWLHRFSGLAAWVLAATAITVIHLAPEFAPELDITIAYLVIIGVVLILQEIITIIEMIRNRNSLKVNVLGLQESGKYPGSPITPPVLSVTDVNRKTKWARLLLLGLFVVICWGLAIALIVLIALA